MTLLSRLTHIVAAFNRRRYFDHVTENHVYMNNSYFIITTHGGPLHRGETHFPPEHRGNHKTACRSGYAIVNMLQIVV